MVPKVDLGADEIEMARTLIGSKSPGDFDLANYKDTNTERLQQLIEAKVAGKEIVAPPVPEQSQVLNLMDALKKSVAQLQAEDKPVVKTRPPKKIAQSGRGETADKKQKTS